MNAWKEFPLFLGSFLALIALSAALINGVDPVQCVIRGGVCYLVGSFTASLWNMFFTSPHQKPVKLVLETPQSHQELEPGKAVESSEAA